MAADEKRARSSPSPAWIPDDVVRSGILMRLPVKTLLRFKSVCKLWLSTIQDPCFADLHYNHSLHHRPQFLLTCPCKTLPVIDYSYPRNALSIDHEGHTESINVFDFIVYGNILSRFHGLILYSDAVNCRRICNPITKEYMTLPDLIGDPPPSLNQEFFSYFDIGYDGSTRQHKVLHTRQVVQYYPEQDDIFDYSYTECDIITLGGGGGQGWRKLNQRPPHLVNPHWKAYQNGAVHWRNIAQPFDDHPLKELVIVAFDFEDEKFRVLPVPVPHSVLDVGVLQVMGEYLGLLEYDQNTVDLWVLQDYSKLIWIRHTFQLPLDLLQDKCIPIGALPTGQIIMKPVLNPYPFSLHYYDLVSKTSRKVEFTSLPFQYSHLGYQSYDKPRHFVESLYSWNGRNA